MKHTWVVRPKPHGISRLKEFLEQNIVAIGWPNVGDFNDIHTRDEIKDVLRPSYSYGSGRKLGQAAGCIYRFREMMQVGEYVIVPDGNTVYIGEISSDYTYNKKVDNNKEGYPHQRAVKWYHDKKGIKRNMLTGRVFDSLKGRQTLFTTYVDDIRELVENKQYLFSEHPNRDLENEYLGRLQDGGLSNINSSTFEDAVKKLLDSFFPGIERLGTNNSAVGDTDLIAELPGDVTIRVQVKHFYKNLGDLKPEVVDQLADSMDDAENGIIITSGGISDEAKAYANTIKNKSIGFIDGREFVEMLFESIDELPPETLAIFGLKNELSYL